MNNQSRLSTRTAKAGVWTIGARVATKAIDFLTLILLARLLGPADFGLVAMAMTVIFIAEVVLEMPLAAALVRIETPTVRMLDTAFTLGAIRGLLLASILGGVAWPLARIYHEPRLALLLLVLALAPVSRGLISPAMIYHSKRMNFRPQTLLEVLSKVTAFFVAVTIALLTRSYWAIALGTIVTPFVMLVLSYVLAPMRPRLSLSEWPIFADMISWNMLSQLLTAVNWQIDRLVLPKFVVPAEFGRYAMANDLSALPGQLLAVPIWQPLNVAFVEANNRSHIKETYLKAMSSIVMVLAPLLCFAAFMATDLIAVFLGEKWHGSAPIMSALLLAALISVPTFPMNALALSLNQSRQITFRNLAELAARVPLTVGGVVFYGILGVVWAKGLASLAVLAATMLAVKRMTGSSLLEQVGAIAWPLAALVPGCALLWIGANILRSVTSNIFVLIIGFSGYALVYMGMLFILRKKLTAGDVLSDLFRKRRSARGVVL